jgi:hypothetical protein
MLDFRHCLRVTPGINQSDTDPMWKIVKDSAPYISFVVTARNDNHGGDLLDRMQIFVTALLHQLKKHNIQSELILVEWNPPRDRSPLAQALSWPQDTGPCAVRIIQVPPEVHSRFKHSEKLPLFQMIAKNVGMRRARGRFILATNIDLLFSDELMSYLAKRKLDADAIYRIDRWDVRKDVPRGASIEEQLDYCRKNILRVSTKEGTVIIPKRKMAAIYSSLLIYIYMFFWRVVLFLRYAIIWMKPWIPTIRHLRGLSTRKGWIGMYNHLMIPFRNSRILSRLVGKIGSIQKPPSVGDNKTSPPISQYLQLHAGACGDFELLSRERWSRICGYPEWEVFSMHIDSVGLYAAFFDGAREIVLKSPMRIYHIEHGSGWTPEGDAEMYRHIESLGIPIMTAEDFYSCIAEMHSGRYSYNNRNWGLVEYDLPEILVSPSRNR